MGLRLSVSLYTFFPLVSELASELASGIFMKQSQVTIVGANAANQQPDKTVVLINLAPLGEKFDNSTAFLTSHRFWHKKVVLKASYFGDYDVLYLNYPGRNNWLNSVIKSCVCSLCFFRICFLLNEGCCSNISY